MSHQESFNLFRRFSAYLRPQLKLSTGLLLLMLLEIPVGMLTPYLIQRLVDDAVERQTVDDLLMWAGLLLGLTVIAVLIRVLGGFWNILISTRIVPRLRLRLFRHVQRLPLRFFSGAETGYLMSRQLDDVGQLGGVMPSTLAAAIVNSLKAVVFAGLLFWLEWHLALCALIFALFIFTFQFLISGTLRRKSRISREKWSKVSESLHQGISGHYLIQSSASEGRETLRFAGVLHDCVRADVDRQTYHLMTGEAFRMVSAFVPPLLAAGGTYLIVTSSFTVGKLFAFFMYLQQMVGAVTAVAGTNPALQTAFASLERIFQLLDTDVELDSPTQGQRLSKENAGIEIERVSFGYQDDQTVLHDIDVRIPPRSMVALVGPSGAGKTTLSHLLSRFYDPDEGAIRIAGVDLREYSLKSLRSRIGIVPQDVFLFDRTVAENLSVGSVRASRQRIEAAARAANALEFIEDLPQGFDTLIGERGVRLSGGQRQRLAIARELLRDPTVIILDEATSALDSHSEALVQAALDTLLEGRTSVVIAHRLSTVIRADLILVLDQGRIVEQGTHRQLLARKELYSQLYETQFSEPEETRAELAAPAAGG